MQPPSTQNPNSDPKHHHHHHFPHFHHHCPPFRHHHIPVSFCPNHHHHHHNHHCHLHLHHPQLHATRLPCNSTHLSSYHHLAPSPLSQTPVNQISQGQEIHHAAVSGLKLPPQELATGSVVDDYEEEEDVFVLTDEWAEFFAKSEAKRQLAKQNKKKGRK